MAKNQYLYAHKVNKYVHFIANKHNINNMRLYIVIKDNKANAFTTATGAANHLKKHVETIKRQLSGKHFYRCNEYDIYLTEVIKCNKGKH